LATESTNSSETAKTGNGRMVAYGLIAVAVVLFILGLTDSYSSDLAIHPMDQFIVEPLFGGDTVGVVHDHQRDALDGACGGWRSRR
jgi:F-type H+-transporting ATPase subunit a